MPPSWEARFASSLLLTLPVSACRTPVLPVRLSGSWSLTAPRDCELLVGWRRMDLCRALHRAPPAPGTVPAKYPVIIVRILSVYIHNRSVHFTTWRSATACVMLKAARDWITRAMLRLPLSRCLYHSLCFAWWSCPATIYAWISSCRSISVCGIVADPSRGECWAGCCPKVTDAIMSFG